ncbi:fibrosin-1-like protein [Grus japonensis]|uniref:Fibrosin-1-like protein n=1 Tax=Grus japonensis TaxID=30415 RepID=A0ABC9XIS3_GRUJA
MAVDKDMSLKPQERKEKWERHPGKKPRESENCVSAEPSENGHNNDAGSSEREAERGKERMKKKLPLKLSKQSWTQVEIISQITAFFGEDVLVNVHLEVANMNMSIS